MKKLLLFLSLGLVSVTLPAQNTWLKKAFYGGAKRERAVGFAIGTKGYIGTGQDTANYMRNDFWEYDPVADTWTQKANFSGVARRDAIGFSNATKGYLGTGMDNAISSFGNTLVDMWEYDPVSNTWTQKANFPGNFGFGIYYASSFAIGNKGYVCAGKEGNSNYSDELWEYDMTSNFWQKKANFPGGVRYGAAAFAMGTKGYVGLGADENVFCSDFWEWDQFTNNWTKKASFPASARFNCSGFAINGMGYFCLGTDGGYRDELFMYDPANDSWYQKTSFGGGARRSAAGFVINGKGYLGTGKGVSGCSQGFWEYTPGITAVEEKSAALTVSVFPNPMITKAVFSITGTAAPLSVSLYELSGKEVMREAEVQNGAFIVEKGNMAAGVYIYIISSGSQALSSGKLIVE